VVPKVISTRYPGCRRDGQQKQPHKNTDPRLSTRVVFNCNNSGYFFFFFFLPLFPHPRLRVTLSLSFADFHSFFWIESFPVGSQIPFYFRPTNGFLTSIVYEGFNPPLSVKRSSTANFDEPSQAWLCPPQNRNKLPNTLFSFQKTRSRLLEVLVFDLLKDTHSNKKTNRCLIPGCRPCTEFNQYSETFLPCSGFTPLVPCACP